MIKKKYPNKIAYYAQEDDVRIVGAWFGGAKDILADYARMIL